MLSSSSRLFSSNLRRIFNIDKNSTEKSIASLIGQKGSTKHKDLNTLISQIRILSGATDHKPEATTFEKSALISFEENLKGLNRTLDKIFSHNQGIRTIYPGNNDQSICLPFFDSLSKSSSLTHKSENENVNKTLENNQYQVSLENPYLFNSQFVIFPVNETVIHQVYATLANYSIDDHLLETKLRNRDNPKLTNLVLKFSSPKYAIKGFSYILQDKWKYIKNQNQIYCLPSLTPIELSYFQDWSQFPCKSHSEFAEIVQPTRFHAQTSEFLRIDNFPAEFQLLSFIKQLEELFPKIIQSSCAKFIRINHSNYTPSNSILIQCIDKDNAIKVYDHLNYLQVVSNSVYSRITLSFIDYKTFCQSAGSSYSVVYPGITRLLFIPNSLLDIVKRYKIGIIKAFLKNKPIPFSIVEFSSLLDATAVNDIIQKKGFSSKFIHRFDGKTWNIDTMMVANGFFGVKNVQKEHLEQYRDLTITKNPSGGFYCQSKNPKDGSKIVFDLINKGMYDLDFSLVESISAESILNDPQTITKTTKKPKQVVSQLPQKAQLLNRLFTDSSRRFFSAFGQSVNLVDGVVCPITPYSPLNFIYRTSPTSPTSFAPFSTFSNKSTPPPKFPSFLSTSTPLTETHPTSLFYSNDINTVQRIYPTPDNNRKSRPLDHYSFLYPYAQKIYSPTTDFDTRKSFGKDLNVFSPSKSFHSDIFRKWINTHRIALIVDDDGNALNKYSYMDIYTAAKSISSKIPPEITQIAVHLQDSFESLCWYFAATMKPQIEWIIGDSVDQSMKKLNISSIGSIQQPFHTLIVVNEDSISKIPNFMFQSTILVPFYTKIDSSHRVQAGRVPSIKSLSNPLLDDFIKFKHSIAQQFWDFISSFHDDQSHSFLNDFLSEEMKPDIEKVKDKLGISLMNDWLPNDHVTEFHAYSSVNSLSSSESLNSEFLFKTLPAFECKTNLGPNDDDSNWILNWVGNSDKSTPSALHQVFQSLFLGIPLFVSTVSGWDKINVPYLQQTISHHNLRHCTVDPDILLESTLFAQNHFQKPLTYPLRSLSMEIDIENPQNYPNIHPDLFHFYGVSSVYTTWYHKNYGPLFMQSGQFAPPLYDPRCLGFAIPGRNFKVDGRVPVPGSSGQLSILTNNYSGNSSNEDLDFTPIDNIQVECVNYDSDFKSQYYFPDQTVWSTYSHDALYFWLK